jgi:hypothetical protein
MFSHELIANLRVLLFERDELGFYYGLETFGFPRQKVLGLLKSSLLDPPDLKFLCLA